jgi:hypothetical protein
MTSGNAVSSSKPKDKLSLQILTIFHKVAENP